MSKFFNTKYSDLEMYTPGEQPQDMEYIKLNTNESPYPPSDKVLEAVNTDEIKSLRLYPDPTGKMLKERIAALYGFEAENVYLANGSDDILNFAFMAWPGEKNKAYFPEVSYGFYKVFAKLNQVTAVEVPLNQDFSIQALEYTRNDGLIVIANPNAPTGLCLSLEKIACILKHNPDQVVVIDEAYIDFGGQSALPLVKEYPNLLVVQTFSKSRSMAGSRLGYAIGNKELISDLETLKYSTNPYNINRLSLILGAAAIDSNEYYVEKCQQIIETREFTYEQLIRLGFEVIPSKANFLFAKSTEISGLNLYTKLKENGILVRHFSNPKINQYIRISIGTRSQMEKFISVVNDILNQ